MAGVTYSFGDGPIRRHLAALALLHRSHYDRARRNIGEYLLGEVQDRLDGQRLVDGTPMPQSKAAIKRGRKTLIDHHNLYDSYTPYQLTRDGVEVGSNKIYAAIHHFGGDAGRNHSVHLPARPVLGATDADERRIGDFLIQAIEASQ